MSILCSIFANPFINHKAMHQEKYYASLRTASQNKRTAHWQ